jgi:hypothetical protein
MQKVESGEIAHIGRLIDESVALELGVSVMELYAEYCRHSYVNMQNEGTLNICKESNGNNESEIKNIYTNAITLSAEYFQLYDGIRDEIIDITDDMFNGKKTSVGADIFFGQATGGRWHIDGYEEYRVLVNLSKFPISLLVATDWSNTDLGKDWDTILDYDKSPPKEFETITYSPGEAVALNNCCERDKQTPHVGSNEEGKMFLRFFAQSFEEL